MFLITAIPRDPEITADIRSLYFNGAIIDPILDGMGLND
jgi:hypothetical protein